MTREKLGTSTPLYHRQHYKSRGQLFDVRLGSDGSAINDGPNPAEWTGASWNRGALRMFFSSNLIEYAWPAVASQQNNGNLYRQDHFVPTALDGAGAVSAWMMSADYYCYDSLNRVAQTAEETYTSGGGYASNVFNQQFSYDRFGNRLVSSATGTGVSNPGYKINGANNRLIAPTDADGSQASDKMRYDVSGNLIKDTHTQMGTTGNRIYDAENRMLTADGANGLANSYAYDADGHRTRRSINNGGEVWWQVYGIGGELVAEYQLVSGTPTLKKECGYRNGQLLVIAETTGTCEWLVTDALGTPRMIADQMGSLAGIKRRDYLPFGEEILAGVGHRQTANGYSAAQSQQPRQQFTGKERDSETGWDYFEARYYGSLQGRFTSPDEFTGGPDELYDFVDVASDNPTFYANIYEPQSLNKYQYCYNNPLIYVDPDGHEGGRIAEFLEKAADEMARPPNPPGIQKAGRALKIAIVVGGGLAAILLDDDEKDPGSPLTCVKTGNVGCGNRQKSTPKSQPQQQPQPGTAPQPEGMAKPTPQPTTPEPQPTPTPTPRRGHRKGARKSTKGDHEKVRPGDKHPPNYIPFRHPPKKPPKPAPTPMIDKGPKKKRNDGSE